MKCHMEYIKTALTCQGDRQGTGQYHYKGTGQYQCERTGQYQCERTGQYHCERTGQYHCERTGQYHYKRTVQYHYKRTGQYHYKRTGQYHTRGQGNIIQEDRAISLQEDRAISLHRHATAQSKKRGNVRRHNASAGLSSLRTASASIPSTSVSNQLHFHVFLTSLSMDFICPGSTLSRSMISFLLDIILTDVRRRIVQ